MPQNKNRRTKRNGRRSTKRLATTNIIDHGRAELGTLSSTSSSGITVVNSYPISTSLNVRWTALANLYQRWRIKSISFLYTSQIATTNNGRIAMSVNEDADGTAPTSFAIAMEQRCAAEGAGRNNIRMTYRPKHEGWLWTGDLSLNEDRLEYPGVLHVLSGSFTSAGVPGYITYVYTVEFSLPCTSSTAARRALPRPRVVLAPTKDEILEAQISQSEKNDRSSDFSVKDHDSSFPDENVNLQILQAIQKLQELMVRNPQ